MFELDLVQVQDKISPWILKEDAEALCLPLSMVYNKSLVTGELPRIWMTANVVSIYKGDRQVALNYRPVSLTCIPCKVMEKCAKKKKKTIRTSGEREFCYFEGKKQVRTHETRPYLLIVKLCTLNQGCRTKLHL